MPLERLAPQGRAVGSCQDHRVLHAEATGDGSPVVLLHGFTQSARSWGPVAAQLAIKHRVITIDAPGHGASAGVRAGISDGADLMVVAAPSPAAWVGYSMGGRFALQVALRHPESVSRLVLVSTTAGIDDPDDRARRREADERLATRIEAEGVEPFLREWLSQPLFSNLPPEAAGLESRLGSTAEGLASSLRLAGAAEQEPAWQRLRSLSMPVLVVTGGLDAKYAAIGERLVSGIGTNARLCVIAGAGHACHLERPEAFVEAVTPFLAGES
jgi:2-succinyl-6-hydroxy-2,4-cyclohexadiene-1-carboxylate synthase